MRTIYSKIKICSAIRVSKAEENHYMAETLGEKLRQAREERGISISEVAEQTRISSLYLESIEKDDYKILPGGIFNKGFIKSYAKYIGYDEHQALQEYQKAVVDTEEAKDPELRLYKPEVLTDDRSGASMAPTIIFAVIILGLVTAGILFLVNYIQNKDNSPVVANTSVNSNSNGSNVNNTAVQDIPAVPSMNDLHVEFSTISDDVSVTAQADGKSSSILVSQDKPVSFTAKENLKLSYSKSLANAARLKINGREIGLPAEPENPRRAAIEFVINKDNIATIWQKGKITFGEEEPVVTPTPETVAPAATEVPTQSTPAPPQTTPNVERTPRPVATPVRTPTPRQTPKPSPTRNVIIVGEPTPRPARTP